MTKQIEQVKAQLHDAVRNSQKGQRWHVLAYYNTLDDSVAGDYENDLLTEDDYNAVCEQIDRFVEQDCKKLWVQVYRKGGVVVIDRKIGINQVATTAGASGENHARQGGSAIPNMGFEMWEISDLLTANMDELWGHKGLDYTDLRVKSGAVGLFQKTDDFYEKLDLMITGMISWSCNFGMTADALRKLLQFLDEHYHFSGLFDSKAFADGWGYEDIAMGIDALYCGLDIWIADDIEVLHKSHNRSDTLFQHIKGRHSIMERVRKLEKLKLI